VAKAARRARPTSPVAPSVATDRAPDRVTVVTWYLAAGLTFWSFGFTVMQGADLWWHLAGGRWIVDHGAVRAPDPFSYTTAGRYWLNDAWLSDVLLYLWAHSFGLESLAYWKWLVIVVTWLILFRLLVRLSGDRLASWIAATFGLAVAAPFLDVRPQLYALLGWVLVLDATLGRPQPRPWLPIVFLIWANLHASFVLGLLTLPVVLFPGIRRREERRRNLVLVAVCCAVTLINPHGGAAVVRALEHAFHPSSPIHRVGEWLPSFEPGGLRSWLYPYGIGAFVAATLLVMIDAERRRSPDIHVAVALGTMVLAMSLRSRRFVPLFGMGESLVLALALARLGVVLRRWIPSLVPALGALALAGVWLAPYPKTSSAFHYLTADFEFPVETLNFVEANALSGNVFAYYGWGGYVDLRTQGRLKVFIDPRAETVFADETYADYMTVLDRKPGWIDIIERSGADFVLWPRWQASDVLTDLLRTGRWRSLYRDSVSQLLVRATTTLPDPLVASPESPYRQLGLGVTALRQDQLEAARRHLERALEADPDLQPACTTLVEVQLLGGDVTNATATAARCSAMYPDRERDERLRAIYERLRAARRD
jgi:hypothetical protein